jgi:hypothetical protein
VPLNGCQGKLKQMKRKTKNTLIINSSPEGIVIKWNVDRTCVILKNDIELIEGIDYKLIIEDKDLMKVRAIYLQD